MQALDEPVKLLNLRLDEALHRQLTTEARCSVRSLNGEIIFRLRRSLARPPEHEEAM
jgi:predicted HicB family RNase H-like nuclease